MGVNFIVPLVVYPFDVMFSVGQKDMQLRNVLKKTLVEEAFKVAYSDDFLIGFNPDSVEAGQTLFINGHRQTIIRLGWNPSHGVVAHEIFHAVEMIMRFLKMPLCADNDEAYAYLIGYLTDKFYSSINK